MSPNWHFLLLCSNQWKLKMNSRVKHRTERNHLKKNETNKQKPPFSISHEGLDADSYFKSLLEHSYKQNIWKPICEVLLRTSKVPPLNQNWLNHDFWKWLLTKGSWVQQVDTMLKRVINLQMTSRQERDQRGFILLFWDWTMMPSCGSRM